MRNIAMLGSGFIGRFYADSIQGYRNRDRIVMIQSRSEKSAERFANDYQTAHWTTSIEKAVAHPDVDTVIIALPNYLHEEAVRACAKHKKPVLCTKPLGRNAEEGLRMLKAVEESGIFHGYLEDLVYTPKFIKSWETIKSGALGRILWARSREAHPGPHSDWFWNAELAGGGAMLDLGCHCVEIARTYIGKDIRPMEVMCWADTQVKPIDAEDHAIGLVKYQNGAIGQFEVSWTFRGGLDLRDEVMGSEGTIWSNGFLRTGLEIFTTGAAGAGYVAEKAETDRGWLYPVGDELNELGYNHMFADMFDAIETQRSPRETFYDGYVVNAILDAAYKSARSKQWEPVQLAVWHGLNDVEKISAQPEYDADHWLVKEEVTHYGAKKVILKEKKTGKIIERVI
ncbi:MAG TPA: Gfo/Idh/MocA family oxidoreductase [Saprospiraceae bacterium]|nr:Gfo/Idh/MocA family oxidoreductase [Saprospiraceae bacterium]